MYYIMIYTDKKNMKSIIETCSDKELEIIDKIHEHLLEDKKFNELTDKLVKLFGTKLRLTYVHCNKS